MKFKNLAETTKTYPLDACLELCLLVQYEPAATCDTTTQVYYADPLHVLSLSIASFNN